MADQGYVAQFTARVALDKKEIAQQVLSQFQNMQALADKNQIVYKFTADTSELEKILADIQKKDIKIGTDIVLTTSERDLQNQINQIQNMLKQKARGITSTLQTTIADVFSQNPISIKDMIVAEGIGKTATEKNVKKLAENIQAEINSIDITAMPVDQLLQKLRIFESFKSQLSTINSYLTNSDKLDAEKYSKTLSNLFRQTASFLASNEGHDSINKTIASLNQSLEEMHNRIIPLAKQISDLLSGKSIGQINTEKQADALKEVNDELERQRKLYDELNKQSASKSTDYSTLTASGFGLRITTQWQKVHNQDANINQADLKELLDLYNAAEQRGIKIMSKIKDDIENNLKPLLTISDVPNNDAKLQEVSEEIARLERLRDQLESDVKASQESTTSGEIIDNEELIKTNAEIEKLESELDSLNGELEKSRNHAKELEETVSKLGEDNSFLESENRDLAGDVYELKTQLSELQEKADTLRDSLQSVAGTDDATSKIADFVEEIKQLTQEINTLKNANDQLNGRVEKLHEQLSESQSDYDKQTVELERYKKELDESKSKVQELTQKITTLDKQLEEKSVGYDEAIKNAKKYADSIDLYAQALKQLGQADQADDVENKEKHFDKAATYFGLYVESMKEAGKEYKHIISEINQQDVSQQLLDKYTELQNRSSAENRDQVLATRNELAREKISIQDNINTQEKRIKELEKEIQVEKELDKQLEKTSATRRKAVKETESAATSTKGKAKETTNVTNGIKIEPEITAEMVRAWKEKITQALSQIKVSVPVVPAVDIDNFKSDIEKQIQNVPINVHINPDVSHKDFEDDANKKTEDINANITILPSIDIQKWQAEINDKVKAIHASISVDLDIDKQHKDDLRKAANHLVMYNSTLDNHKKYPSIVSERDVELATQAKKELLSLYPELEKFQRRKKIISDTDLFNGVQSTALENVKQSIKEINELIQQQLYAFDKENKQLDNVIASEEKYLDRLINKLQAVIDRVNLKTDAFIDEGAKVKSVITEECDALSQLNSILYGIREKVSAISRQKIKVEYEEKTAGNSTKTTKEAEKKKKKEVYDAYKEMLAAYKEISANEFITNTASGEATKRAAQENADAQRKIYDEKKKIIDANSEIISQEKVLEDLAKIDMRRSAKENIANAKAEDAKAREAEKQAAKEASDALKQAKKEADRASKEADDAIKEAEKKREKIRKQYDKFVENREDQYKKASINRDVEDFSPAYKEKLNDLRKTIDALRAFDKETGSMETLDKLNKEVKEAYQTVNSMRGNVRFELVRKEDIAEQIANLEKFRKKNSAMSLEFRERYEEIAEALRNAFKNGINKADFSELISQLKTLDAEFYKVGKTGKSMWDRILVSARSKTAQFIGMYLSLYDWIRYVRQGVTTVVELDSALTELRKVSDATDQRLAQSFKASTETAKELGSTITDVINITADWARLGYSVDDSEQLAKITALFKNVGDNMEASDASSFLISTMQGFHIAAEDAEDIVDKYNEVANNFAIDTAGIGEALQRSAASFDAANTSLSESIALVTATNEVIQNPETVGTMWKTLSARIRGAKTELEELGEETDAYTETTSKLRDLVKGLTGFDIMEDETTFKSIYDIIVGIGKEWNKLTDVERASLGEALAGKRNSNALFAVLGNLDQLQKAYATAENAAGSAAREQENYERSIQYSIDKTKASLQSLAQTTINSDVVKDSVEFVNKLVNGVESLVKNADKLKPILSLLLAITTKNIGGSFFKWLSNASFVSQIKEFADGAKNLSLGFQLLSGTTSGAIDVKAISKYFNEIKAGKSTMDAFAIASEGASGATVTMLTKLKAGEITIEEFTAAEKSASLASTALASALATVGIAISTYLIHEAAVYMDNIAETAQSATDRLDENANKLNKYISSIKDLREKLDDSNTSTEEAVQYNIQLKEIQKELIELYGDSAKEIDIFNGSLEEQGEIIEKLNGLSTSDIAQQKWLNEVNEKNWLGKFREWIARHQVNIGKQYVPKEVSNFDALSNYEQIKYLYEHFSKSIKKTNDETLNRIIASYENVKLINDEFYISGNVEDVQDVIVDIQTRLKSYAGYTEEFAAALTDAYNSAGKFISDYGDTYNQGLAFAVGNDETARTFQTQLEDAVKAYDKAATDAEKEVAKQSILSILTAINDSDLDEALKRYLTKQSGFGDSYEEIIAKRTVEGWKSGLDALKQYRDLDQKIQNSGLELDISWLDDRVSAEDTLIEMFGASWSDRVDSEAFQFFEKLSNGAYISADIPALSEQFKVLADALHIDNEQLLELLRLLGLLDNKDAVAASLTAPGQRTAQKNYVAKQILETEDGLEIYNQLIADGYGDYLEGEASPEKLAFIKRYYTNYRNAIIAELEKTGKTIDAWFEKNGDFVDDYQKNLASINEAISGYYSGTLSPDDMIDLYQEFPEIIESSDDLGTVLKKLRVKQIEKLYDDLGEDVPDKLRLELQRLEDQADQTAEALNDFSFENTVQSLKDGVEMIQSLNAGFEDGERGFDTIFSDDFVKMFGKYKKEYSALVKTVETKGFKTNKKLQEQARQQANALGNIWLKDNIGLLSEEELNTAKAMFEELGFQIEGVAMDIQSLEEAQQEATKAGIDWDNMNAESIQHLIDLGTITKATAQEILWFKMQETIANMTSLETDKSIANLLELLSTINMVAGGITGLSGLMAEINSIQATYTAGRPYIDSKTGQVRDIKDVLQDTLDKWRGSLTDWTIPDTSDFGTGKDKDKGGGSDDKEKETEEVVDWIEKLIDRLERKLEHLEKVAGSTYETWENRANSLVEALEVTKQEIDAQRAAYERYMAEANAVGLDESYAQKIRDGAIDIETITDEELKNKIDKYDEYYTKALDAEEKIYDLTLHLSELAQQQFELIQTKFEKMITAIETSIQHVQNEIDDIFQKTLSSSYDEMIASHRDEISQLEAEYQELTQSLTDSINAGYITEGTEAWYDMKNAIDEVSNSLQEQRNQIHELIKEQFDLIDALYSGVIEGMSLAYDKIDAAVEHLETLGFVEAAGLYRRQLTEQIANLKQYYDEVTEQQQAFEKAVKEGMEEGSDAWNEMTSAINDTWNNIISTTSAIDELRVALWELDWSKFEHGQAMIRNVIDEANFLISMFKEDSLIDDYGFFTDNGVTVEGLHMQNFQTYKSQAQDYLDQIKAIEDMMNGNYNTNPEMLIQLIDDWIKDVYDVNTSDWKYEDYLSYADLFSEDLSYNDKLLQQKQELIDAYQDAVKGAEDEKQAIIDLINQAYDQQLAYINKLIDAKKEQLDVDKDLYEYSKNVKEQTDNIGKLQNQLAAIANDNSEEAMARRQKLQAQLDEAQKQLDDTQYDRWHSDQQEMLDKLSEEYGEMIDEVKKNTDANFLQIQQYLDNNLGQVNDALNNVADKVGYEIQENAFADIWGSSSTVSDVLGGVQNTLSSILEFNEKLYSAATNIADWFTRWLGMESTVSDDASADTLVNSFYQAFLDRNAEEAGYLDWFYQLRNGASVLDIVKGFMYSEEYMSKNKSDAEKIEDLYQSLFGRSGSVEEISFWLEKIVRDGLSWDDVIAGFVNSAEFAQSKIWQGLMADTLGINSGYEGGWLEWMNENSIVDDGEFKDYINEKLKGGGLVVHPVEDLTVDKITYAQNIGSISFELPNVTDYTSFVKQAQSDPNFEKMIQSMTINQLNGASALSKFKY